MTSGMEKFFREVQIPLSTLKFSHCVNPSQHCVMGRASYFEFRLWPKGKCAPYGETGVGWGCVWGGLGCG